LSQRQHPPPEDRVSLDDVWCALQHWWPQFVRDGSAHSLRAVNKAMRAATTGLITGGRVHLGNDLGKVTDCATFHSKLPRLSRLDFGLWYINDVEDADVEVSAAARAAVRCYVESLAQGGGGNDIKTLCVYDAPCAAYERAALLGCQETLGGAVETLCVPWSPDDGLLQCVTPRWYPNLRHLRLSTCCASFRDCATKLAGQVAHLVSLEALEVSGCLGPRALVSLALALPRLRRLCMSRLLPGLGADLGAFLRECAAELAKRQLAALPFVCVCIKNAECGSPMVVRLADVACMLRMFPELRELRGSFFWLSREGPSPGQLEEFCATPDDRARGVLDSMQVGPPCDTPPPPP
jgi:hypothetical protein